MRTLLAFSIVAVMSAAVPAYAQVAGTPGAIGSTGAMSGHNTPGSGVSSRRYVHRYHRHYHHHMMMNHMM